MGEGGSGEARSGQDYLGGELMRSRIASLTLFALIATASIAHAVEPITAGEIGRACATGIGNLQVELWATQIQAGKLQAEVDKLKEAAKPKEPEKK